MAIDERDLKEAPEVIVVSIPDTVPAEFVDENATIVIDEPEVEDEVVTEPEVKVLTLADALRKAAKMGIKQTTGTYVKSENEACALGAAFLVARAEGLIK